MGNKYEVSGMSNLGPDDTGLPLAVMLSQFSAQKKIPRLKVAKKTSELHDEGENFSLSISAIPTQIAGQVPKDVRTKSILEVSTWIVRNRSMLLKYWFYIENSTRIVERHLETGTDAGKTFDEILFILSAGWQAGMTLQAVAKFAKIDVHAAELIIKMNTKVFPKRK